MSQGFVSLVCRRNVLSYVLDYVDMHEHVSFLTTPKTIRQTTQMNSPDKEFQQAGGGRVGYVQSQLRSSTG